MRRKLLILHTENLLVSLLVFIIPCANQSLLPDSESRYYFIQKGSKHPASGISGPTREFRKHMRSAAAKIQQAQVFFP